MGAGHSRRPREYRSPRKFRTRLDGAAREIAASPAQWPRVVDELRRQIGRPPLSVDAVKPHQWTFFRLEAAGRRGLVPLERLEPLDAGGMNTVCRTCDLVAGRPLVVRKHLPAESAIEEQSRRLRDALVRERLTVLPRHPVIQRFWAAGSLEGEPCELFDFAKGTTFSRHVVHKGMTLGELLDVAFHAARGLLHLQRHGLVHGDVKPENLCVEERPGGGLLVRLIDFDIVATAEEQVDEYALSNSLDGTLPYMPPENFVQAVPDDPAEARRMVLTKDVFALGMSFVRTLNGRFPNSFYTSKESLVRKKEALEEAEFTLPEGLPRALADLIHSMCRADWRARPPLPVVVRIIDGLRRAATPAERQRVLTLPREEPSARPAPPAAAEVETVGPYRLVNRSFAARPAGYGQSLPLAELEDPFGRRLVGVPYALATKAEEEAFYEERVVLLRDLNAVRLRHPELFPGSFRDLVRQSTADGYLVWVVRPLLSGARDVTRYLAEERPDATLKERVAILRRVGEALAVLESAGYTLSRLTPELVFFVPRPAEGTEISASKLSLTRPISSLFDLPASRSGIQFRQELMGTASARKATEEATGRIVADFFELATHIGVLSRAGDFERGVLLQIADVGTWRERVDLLVWLEMQCR